MPPPESQPVDPQQVLAIRERLAATFAALFARAGQVELQRLGVGDPVAVFDAKRPDIQQRALTLADDTLGRISRTAGDRVRRVISEELGKGKDHFQIADALRTAFAGMSQRQARTVMRTVSRDLYNGASLDAYEAMGITHAFAHDGFGGLTGKTDPDCVARNGNRYTIAEAREQEHSPVTHPNCTLYWTPDVSTLPEDGPLPGLSLGGEVIHLDFNPAEPRDDHGRWRDEFGLPGLGEPVLQTALRAVEDLAERDKPLTDRAEFQTQQLSEHLVPTDEHGDPLDVGADSTRAEAKKEVARHLRARLVNDPRWESKSIHAIDSEAVPALIDQWAESSGDTQPLSIAIQIAAAKELLGQDLTWRDIAGNGSANDAEMEHRLHLWLDDGPDGAFNSLRAFARAQYEQTQVWLQRRGLKRVILFRGMSLPSAPRGTDENHVNDVAMNPLSSWSLDYDTAAAFAGNGEHSTATMLMAEVPINRIFATPRTGVGCLPEWEIVLLGGGTDEVKIGTINGRLSQEQYLKQIGVTGR